MKINTIGLQIQGFIKVLESQGGTPIYKLPVEEARNVLNTLQAKAVVQKLPADIEDTEIPGGPTGKVSIRIVRPEKNSNQKLPVIMYFHGGGWILGNKETHDRLVREIANGAEAAVVFVNFTPAPEAQFPTQIEEAYFATKYIAENGDKFNVDTKHLVVVGDSVGGNMATVVTLLAKERGGPKITYQVLLYPVTDANFNTESYKQFAEGPWLTKNSMEWFWNAYAPNVADRRKITASPLQATLEQLKNLPPTLLLTNENDVLRDEGEAYAHKLMQAGVEVAAVRYLGAIHDLLLLNPITNTPIARSALLLVTSTLRNVFKK